MYARMGWLAVVLAVVAGLVMVGCEEDQSEPRRPLHNGLIQISVDSDTIFCQSGETVTTEGWVALVDGYDEPMPGVRVHFGLAEHFGFIEFLNHELLDTTDELGRVNFKFGSVGQTGIQTIYAEASCGLFFRQDSIVIVVQETTPYLHVTVDPDTLLLGPGLPDSSFVTVCWYGFPLPSFGFNYDEGTFRFESEDSTNYLAGWWFPECCGTRCFIMMARDLNGNPIPGIPTIPVCVFVDSLR